MPDKETGGTYPIPDGTTKATDPGKESVVGPVFPYRGQEQHGVAVEADPWIPQTGTAELWESRTDVPADETDVKPVAVRIVSEGASENKSWSAGQVTADGNPRELVGRNPRRTRVRIKNLDPLIVVYIGRANGANAISGWPLDPDTEIELLTTDEIHGVSATGAQLFVAILQEFTV